MAGKGLNQKGVAAVLNEVALLLEPKGENPLSPKGYANAARSMETLKNDLWILVEEGWLQRASWNRRRDCCVGIVRKEWLEAGDVLNTMDFEEMKAHLEWRKS